LLTIGGYKPLDCQLLLDNKPLQWCSRAKYLGMQILVRKNVKIDLTAAKVMVASIVLCLFVGSKEMK